MHGIPAVELINNLTQKACATKNGEKKRILFFKTL